MRILKTNIENAITDSSYKHSQVVEWTASIVDGCVKDLINMDTGQFKYIASCIILGKKGGAGFHTASSCFWDSTTDGSYSYRWENKTMIVIVNAFGIAV